MATSTSRLFLLYALGCFTLCNCPTRLLVNVVLNMLSCKNISYWQVNKYNVPELTGLVTPYGDIDLGQHLFTKWLVACSLKAPNYYQATTTHRSDQWVKQWYICFCISAISNNLDPIPASKEMWVLSKHLWNFKSKTVLTTELNTNPFQCLVKLFRVGFQGDPCGISKIPFDIPHTISDPYNYMILIQR